MTENADVVVVVTKMPTSRKVLIGLVVTLVATGVVAAIAANKTQELEELAEAAVSETL